MADTSCITECFTRSKSYGHGGTMKLVNKNEKLFTFKIKQPSWRELLLLALFFFLRNVFFLLYAEVEQSNMYGNV
uniref:Transmembrane protein n=1 Tax=Octopus bimaculoides TaxID=37653 RepID=A0A0L8FTT4_OCTBM